MKFTQILKKYMPVLLSVILVACNSNSFPNTSIPLKDDYQLILEKVVIGYAPGDNQNRITQNIILPTEVETDIEYESIGWKSSLPNVISATGIVNRGEEDIEVTLAVIVVINAIGKEKLFNLTAKAREDLTQSWTITFISNGGSLIPSQTVLDLGQATLPPPPTRDGYKFMGWYENLDLTSPWSFETIILKNLTLYASWEEVGDDILPSRTLLFSDEFNGNNLDLTKWGYQNGNGAEYGIGGWGNGELEYYQPNNLTVSEGILKITAKKEDVYDAYQNRTFPYTSSKIVTQNKYVQTFGRIEAKIKAPVGTGLWPAFWMMPAKNTYGNGWPFNGEIDIMELRGRLPNEVTSAIHYQAEWGHHYLDGKTTLPSEQTINDFHVYGVEWSPGRLEFFFDDHVYHVRTQNDWLSEPKPFDQDFYIILNLAVGGSFDGWREPEASDLPGILEVDYVRTYAYEG